MGQCHPDVTRSEGLGKVWIMEFVVSDSHYPSVFPCHEKTEIERTFNSSYVFEVIYTRLSVAMSMVCLRKVSICT